MKNPILPLLMIIAGVSWIVPASKADPLVGPIDFSALDHTPSAPDWSYLSAPAKTQSSTRPSRLIVSFNHTGVPFAGGAAGPVESVASAREAPPPVAPAGDEVVGDAAVAGDFRGRNRDRIEARHDKEPTVDTSKATGVVSKETGVHTPETPRATVIPFTPAAHVGESHERSHDGR